MNLKSSQSSLKILHVGKYFEPHRGGIETYLKDLMSEQVRQGLSVAALVHGSGSSFRSMQEEYRPTDAYSIMLVRAATWFHVGYVPVNPTFALELNRVVTEFEPDCIHFHFPNLGGLWALLSSRAKKVPWIVTWHSDINTPGAGRLVRWAYRFYRPFEKRMLSNASLVVATSESYLEHAPALHPIRDRCVVLPLGLPQRNVSVVTHSWTPNSVRSFKCLFVGRLAFYKGVDVLLNALSTTRGIELTIVGDGPLRKSLVKKIDILGMADKVNLKGSVSGEELLHCYSDADVVCLPSTDKTEAFGMVLLEAMQFGKPIIATDIPGSGVPWVAAHASISRTVPPGNVRALVEALESMRDQYFENQKAWREQPASLPSVFRLEPQVKKLSQLYLNVISRCHGRDHTEA